MRPATPPDGPRRVPALQRAVLRHPVRRRIHDHVRNAGASGMQDLARELGLSWGGLMWHLRILARVGLVRFARGPQGREVLPGLAPGQVRVIPEVTLQDPALRAMAARITRSPGASLVDLAAEMRVSPCVAHGRVLRLQRAGLVEADGPGWLRDLRPTEDLARRLVR